MTKTLIAYIPALHSGYVNFFKKYAGETLYILDLSLVREIPRLERDIRALEAGDMKKLIGALGIFSRVGVVTKENMAEFLMEAQGDTRDSGAKNTNTIVMPDEDVSHIFAETYLTGKDMFGATKEIEYVSVFLRWDRLAALKTDVPTNPDRIISRDAFDKEIMARAFADAQKSSDWWRQVGAVVVKDGKVLFIGHNHPLPSDQTHNVTGDPRSNFDAGVSIELSKFLHAEAGIIAEAAKRGVTLDGASIYVTTFPCPVCAKSIATAGFKKVYYCEGYSLLDAEDILKGFGVELIQVER